jgi:muconate cycloisomerase
MLCRAKNPLLCTNNKCDHNAVYELVKRHIEAEQVALIHSIETVVVQLPTRREHKWTGLTEPIGRYVLVRMTDTEGRIGWGEAPALKDWGGEFGRYFGESQIIVQTVIEKYLAPTVLGVELGNVIELHSRMDRLIKGYPYAKAAVEFAFYDLSGRALGLPVHYLLGGQFRNRIPVTHSLGLISIAEAEQEAAKVAAEGIKTIKIKVGMDVKRDVEVVRAVRAAVGPDVELCIDANEGYRSPGEAICAVREMEKYKLKYVEQPVEGIEGLAAVARAIDQPVMADESAWNAHDVIQIIDKRAAQIVSIYTTKPGGLYKAMEVNAVCRAAGIICNVNGSVETGVGNLANIQLAAAAPAVVLSCVVPVSTPAEAQSGQVGGIYYKDDLLKRPFKLVEGAIEVPDGPGMGLEIDEAKIEKHRVRP